ncbi:unnamed protein product [Hymenolepis diminuta]|uniref:Nucleolar protein 10 n=2 Tax=Hymenolepis diminuta TaxID=6216 RepID=A0A564Y116_HYMDI|nr:unnamed protein product [Hymenolepis diminuta]
MTLQHSRLKMLMRYYLEDGRRVYTLKLMHNGIPTQSAHPARFSPDDKFSQYRLQTKMRFNLLKLDEKEK